MTPYSCSTGFEPMVRGVLTEYLVPVGVAVYLLALPPPSQPAASLLVITVRHRFCR